MNIGLFTDTYFPQVSGVSTSIKVLADELVKQGHSVFVFTTTDPKVKRDEYGKGNEKNIYRFSSVPFTGFKDRRVTIRGFFEAVDIARILRLDIVHTHTEFSLGLMGKFVARQLKIPSVHTYHTNYADYTHYVMGGKIIKPENVKVIVRSFVHGASAVIAPSSDTKKLLENYKVNIPVEAIPTGLSLPTNQKDLSKKIITKYDLKNKKIVLSLGRLAFEKGTDKLIEVFSQVVKENKKAHLLIVGDGPAKKSLEKQVSDLNLKNKVTFVGMINHDDVYSYYKVADVFVSTSTTETQGLTFIESLNAGTPFVAYPNEFLKSITKNKAVGILADTHTKVKSAIEIYLNNPEYKADFKDREKAINKVSAETFGKTVINLYEKSITNFTNRKTPSKEFTKAEESYISDITNILKKIPKIVPIKVKKTNTKKDEE